MAEGDYTVGELARTVQSVFLQLEGIATRLESGQFVRSELFAVVRASTDKALHDLERDIERLEATKTSKSECSDVARRVTELEEGRKWLSRATVGALLAAGATLLVSLVELVMK